MHKTASFLTLFSLLASTFVAAPAQSQISIQAPSGWKTQSRAAGARTFTPPDLQAGEVFSVTVYDSVPGEGATLEEYLRRFAGPVGKTAGKLASPLKVQVRDGRFVSGTGVYVGPGGKALGAAFVAVSLDGGANIHVSRTLFSSAEVLTRYSQSNQATLTALAERAKGEAGSNMVSVPSKVTQKLKPGGEFVPGIYEGNQYHGQELMSRYRVHLYANGEYRITNHEDVALVSRWGSEKTGNYSYNRNTGMFSVDWTMGLGNRGGSDQFCYFGRNSAGKPAIYAEDNVGYETETSLIYVGPPNKLLSASEMTARAAIIEAEKNRFKWVVKPGKGVPNAKIAAVLLDAKYNGQSVDETVYLLLKDGSVYADLPVPPDELDVLKSKQREPDKWGKWRKVGNSYKVSWEGAPYQNLPGSKVMPSPAQTKLSGRYGTGRFSGMIGMTASSSQWGVTFSKTGRFRKDSSSLTTSSMGFGDNATNIASGSNDGESFAGGSGPGFAFSSSQKRKNPNGAREGDYSLNGYVLTLRYDNGKVARLPFFFVDAAHKGLWFEGSSMSRD